MTPREAVEEFLTDWNPEALFFDGFDDAIVGWAAQAHGDPLVVYDHDEMMDILMDEGLSEEDALEHISYNVQGSWMGENTPLIFHPYHPPEE